MQKSLFLLSFLVLIASPSTAQNDAGTWISRASLPTPRQEMPHVLLDGKIFVIGGIDADRNSVEIVEAYDPKTGLWEEIAALPPTLHHLGAAAANGKLFVIGGYISGFTPTNRVFEFDPSTGLWTEKTPMPQARGAHVAVAINNKIYVVGGEQLGNALTTNQVYDPATDSWAELAPMPTAREHLSATTLNGRVYVIGGRRRINGALDNIRTVEAYDPVTDSWDETPADLLRASGGLAAASLNGRIYAFGGEFFEDDESGVIDMATEYNPDTNSWKELTPMPEPRHGIGAVAVADTVFIIGGGPVAGYATSDVNSGFVPPKAEPTSSEYESPRQPQIALISNYPNPFHFQTTIHYSLNKTRPVTFTLFDVLGRILHTRAMGVKAPGSYEVTWPGADLKNGNYFLRLTAGDFSTVHPIVKY